jgi:hypothetical protein
MSVEQDVQTSEEKRALQAAREYEIEVFGQQPCYGIGTYGECAPADTDGDGVPDIGDNCPQVWNPGQENCNLAAEMTPNQAGGQPATILGDVCDPVPCPNFQVIGSTQNLNCEPNPSCQGQQCTGTFLQETISATTIGAHPADAIVTGPHTIAQLDIRDVPTDPRFCQQNVSLGIDCFSAQSIADRFAAAPEPSPFSTGQPWHRVTVAVPNQFRPGRGTALIWQYGDFSAALTWDYPTDAAYWYASGLETGILPPPPFPPSACISGDLGRCLDGAMWLHAETAVGYTTTVVDTGIGPVSVGTHGQQLANDYAPIQPDQGMFAWCPAAVPGVAGVGPQSEPCFNPGTPNSGVVFAQQGIAQGALANSIVGLAGLVVPESRLLFVVPTITPTIAFLERDGSGVVPVDSQGNCGSAGGTTVLQGEILDPSLVWVGPAEPNARIGPLSGQVAAMALSADGTRVVDAAINMNGNLSSSCEGQATFSPSVSIVCAGGPAGATDDPPAPRRGFASVFSRSAGGVFVLGGASTTTNAPLSDIWFQAFGGIWGQIAIPSFTLGDVVATTFSYRDRRLWILDRVGTNGGHGTTMRLTRVSQPDGSFETMTSWRARDDVSGWFLAIDQDGSVLLSATDERVSMTAQLTFDATKEPHIALFHIEPGKLVHAPLVDDNGYDYVVSGPQGSMRINRLTTLSGECPRDQDISGVAIMEDIRSCDDGF